MGNLSKVSLQNFRKFQNQINIDLFPITIFTGANNTGKSSLLYALKFLHDSGRYHNFKTLDFSSQGEKNSNFDLIKNLQLEDCSISFGFELSNYKAEQYLDPYANEDNKYYTGFSFKKYFNKIEVYLRYEKIETIALLNYIEVRNLNEKIFILEKNALNGHKIYINLKKIFNNSPSFNTKFMETLKNDSVSDENILKLSEIYYDCMSYHVFDNQLWNEIEEKTQHSIDAESYTTADISNIYYIFFRYFHHKIKPDLSYKQVVGNKFNTKQYEKYFNYKISEILRDEILYMHTYFEDFVNQHLLSEISKNFNILWWEELKGNEKILFNAREKNSAFDKIIDGLQVLGIKKRERFLTSWLMRFEIGVTVEINRVKRTYNEILVHQMDGSVVDFCELGKGSQQLLSILLNICFIAEEVQDYETPTNSLNRSKDKNQININEKGKITINNFKNDYDKKHENDIMYKDKEFTQLDLLDFKTIVLMEPEIYLHPNNQSLLSELIVEACQEFGIQFLIETHSEYIIRKLQVLTASKRILSSNIKIYYISKNEEIRNIELDALGNLSHEFKDGFFDEALKSQEDLILQQTIFKLQKDIDTKYILKKKPILLVEDKYSQIYKIAWLKIKDIQCKEEDYNDLFAEYSTFSIHEMNGAGGISGMLRAENLKIVSDIDLIGLYDFDGEGFTQFHLLSTNNQGKQNRNEEKWSTKIEGDKYSCLYKKRNDHRCCYAMLLPVPKHLENLADKDYPITSNFVSIESLLPEQFLLDNQLVEEQKIPNAKYYKCKENKKYILWSFLFGLEQKSFENFRPLFEKIDYLFKNK